MHSVLFTIIFIFSLLAPSGALIAIPNNILERHLGGVLIFFQTILWNMSAIASKDLFVRFKSIFPFVLPLLLKFIPSIPPYNWMVHTYTSKIHTTHTAYNWMVHTYTVYTIHTTLCGGIFQWTRNMLCNICSGWQTCLHLASTLQWIASAFSNKLIRFI